MAKVYVSSTILDLEPERRAVLEWLRAARHQAVDSYLPNSDTVRDSCLDDVDTCDLYVLILGYRYGFQPSNKNPDDLSITHLEFRRAGRSGIPRIALLSKGLADVDKSDMKDPEKARLVLDFREEVERKVRPAVFSDLKDLIQGLSAGVQAELDKLNASPRQWDSSWLVKHSADLAKQLANHMAGPTLKTGDRPEELYLDLVVAERHPGKREEGASEPEISTNPRSLAEILTTVLDQVLLTGEGGGGKTTSLLYTAARLADQAIVEQTAPVPIYVNLARLTKLDDVPDLLQLIADSLPLVSDWSELVGSEIFKRRNILFLFDSFNEMPEYLQRNAVVVLQRFIDKHKDGRGFLVGSRPNPYLDQLAPERQAAWRTPELAQRLLDLALRDLDHAVRAAAAGALRTLGAEDIQQSLADSLVDDAVEVQVAAADALVQLKAEELYGQIAEAMIQVATDERAGELRQRAGSVLSAIPGGVEPFYQPIQTELERSGSERALELIEDILQIIPEDANLFWWRGHALRDLGRLHQAAESYQRAFDLEEQASVIPQALAQTFLDLDDPQRAIEAAHKGVEIDPGDANAQSILAWSNYKGGAIPEAVEAATKALDLDPVHGDAIWIVLLGHLRQTNIAASRSAFQHAQRVRQLLSPGLDTSFVATFANELDSIQTTDADMTRLFDEIRHTLHAED